MPTQITIKFGPANQISKAFEDGLRVSDLINDSTLQAALGFSGNVEAVVDGAVVDGNYRPTAGQTVSLRTKANTKG
jgi:hypothetical protein